jgi:predicted dehydrogenase
MLPLLRVGIAGYGVVGERRRLHIDARDDMQVIGVCDQKFDGDGVFDDGVNYWRRYTDLLNQNIDVLFVCLTNDVAASVTIDGLEKGLHVFCEKPPGRNVSDIERVIECENRHPGQKLKYGFNHRYHDSVRDALEIVKSGELGKVINLRGIYGKSKIINFKSDWRTKRDIAGGGILLDQGIHIVDLMRLFAGEFTEIHSFISNDFWRHDVEDNAYALMRTADGAVAMLHSSATEWRHRFHLDLTLEKGSIVLSGILSGSKSYGDETLTISWADEPGDGDPRKKTTRYTNDPSWADEITEFANAITEGVEIQYGTSVEALRTMELVYAIYCADPDWCKRWHLDADIENQSPKEEVLN